MTNNSFFHDNSKILNFNEDEDKFIFKQRKFLSETSLLMKKEIAILEDFESLNNLKDKSIVNSTCKIRKKSNNIDSLHNSNSP